MIESLGLLVRGVAGLEVVVVANEPSAEVLEAESPDGVKIILAAENLGFAEGANVGVAWAFAHEADTAVIVNDDVELDATTLLGLAGRAGPRRAVAPTITADRPIDAFSGGVIDWRHGFGYHEPGGRDFLTAAMLAVHRETWATVGPFDGTLFLYYEDVDWCLRARAAGIELAVIPDARAHHSGGASSGGTAGATWAYYHTRNRIRMVARYRGRSAAARSWCWTLAWTVGYLRDARRGLIIPQLFALRDAALGRHGRGRYPRD